MNPFAIGLIVFGLFASFIGGVMMLQDRVPHAEPWTIVCNSSGQFSFINFNGEVYKDDYATRQEAEENRDTQRKWSDEYDGRWEKMAARTKGFHPCEEGGKK